MVESALQVFTGYAGAFEQTYVDDDWSRLARYFAEDASYEVRGGPLACQILGREAIFAGMRKSIEGLDRRCSERRLELSDGPNVVETEAGHEVSIGWRVSYQYGDAPKVVLPGRSVFNISNGVIIAMRDEYNDTELEEVGAWMQAYGQDLDGSYV